MDNIELTESAATMQNSLREPTSREISPSALEGNHAAELPTDMDTSVSINRRKSKADNYYEDVDPRFAEISQDVPTMPHNNHTVDGGIPTGLMSTYNARPGPPHLPQSGPQARYNRPNNTRPYIPTSEHNYPARPPTSGQQYIPYAPGRPNYAEFDAPPESPAYSEQTTFTSISQRPVNPRWQPPQGQQPQPSRMQQHTTPVFSGNPDFELPTLPPGRSGPRGRAPGAIQPGLGSDRGGRYPLPPPNMPR